MPRSRTRSTAEVSLSENLTVLLDVEVSNFDEGLLRVVLSEVDQLSLSADFREEVQDALSQHADLGPEMLRNSVAIVHQRLEAPGPSIQVLCRLAEAISPHDEGGLRTKFLWVLLSNGATHPLVARAAEFATLMESDEFRQAAAAASTADDLERAYQDALEQEIKFRARIAPELRPDSRLFAGIIADVRRRLPLYGSDFKDGLSQRSLSAVVLLYFACLAPTVAFGGLAARMTNNEIGTIEMLIATGACGFVYALFSGQPLTILGGIAPVIVLLGIIHDLCGSFGVPFMPGVAWVGLWTMVFLLVLAAKGSCSWIRFFTRFTDDTFAGLISLIFIVEALKPLYLLFTGAEFGAGAAWMSLVLALGTYSIAINLSRFRRTPYLRHSLRELLADFGPTIAIIIMSVVALLNGDVKMPTLKVPLEGIATTSGRPWLVNPFEAQTWVWFAAAGPAFVVTVLFYLDQNITVRLVNSRRNRLQKGAGYHLDLAVLGVVVGVGSLFGLPWMVAATVRSLTHVRALATVKASNDGIERIVSVRENRVTALAVNVLIGLTTLVLPLVAKVPLSVLFGLFLFMGVASMSGNQFFERIRLWLLDPGRYPATYYLRAVPTSVVHKFTAIQFVCLVLLWVVKDSAIKILFPVFVALLVPVRMLIGRLFEREHLALLDGEEDPDQEGDRFT